MPTQIRNSPLTIAIGLAFVVAIALSIIESANGTSGSDRFHTVAIHQESPRAGEWESLEIASEETKTDRTQSAAAPQGTNEIPKIAPIDWLLLDLKMGVSVENIGFGIHVPRENRTPSLRRNLLQQQCSRLRAIRRQITRSKKELEHKKQSLAPSHPAITSTETEIIVMKHYLKSVVDEQSDRTNSEQASRNHRRLKEFFQFEPTQPEAEFSRPSSLDGIVLVRTKTLLGYEATDNQGKRLRRFVDTNLDNVLDTWIYFNNSGETYREIDSNFDEVIDEVQLTKGELVRIGKDTNQDFKIDSWSERRLSDLNR